MGSYRERLWVPVAYWLLAVPVVILLGAETWFLVGGFVPPLVIALLGVIVATFLIHWSLAVVEVSDGVLRADGHTLALSEAGEVVALDERQSRAMRGPRADPSAHILLRPYLNRAVYIEGAEPRDGSPYWLVATRRPDQLAAALSAARDAATRDGRPAAR